MSRGSNSRVLLAEHKKLKAFRAIKCINKTAQDNQPQFLLEADILKNLKHPGIPTIYDVEEDDKSYYIIEEYIQGQSLEAFVLHQDCISIDTVIYMALQICDVVKYLHDQKPEPIIYQDMKPEHIILCGKRIVLIDFGISAYITTHGNTFQNFGTHGYAPPEKYQGISCDVRTDVFGIGKVVEFMAGKMPPHEFQFLKPLIWKATAHSREDRYPSVEAFAVQLDRLAEHGYQNFQQKQNKHLLTELAVAGTQKRVGVTHFAIALTCFYNQYQSPCMYQECHKSESIRLLAKEDGVCIREDGMVVYEKFRGMPYYGDGIDQQGAADGVYVQDYGTQLQELLEEEKPLLMILGSRPWEYEQTKSILERICLREKLSLICNYGNIAQAKKIARLYRHRVYCFPLDADPFRMTREKRKLFQKMLLQEGW